MKRLIYWSCLFTSVSLVMYIGRLEDGTIFERKGSDEEPFEFVTLEGSSYFSCESIEVDSNVPTLCKLKCMTFLCLQNK